GNSLVEVDQLRRQTAQEEKAVPRERVPANAKCDDRVDRRDDCDRGQKKYCDERRGLAGLWVTAERAGRDSGDQRRKSHLSLGQHGKPRGNSGHEEVAVDYESLLRLRVAPSLLPPFSPSPRLSSLLSSPPSLLLLTAY